MLCIEKEGEKSCQRRNWLWMKEKSKKPDLGQEQECFERFFKKIWHTLWTFLYQRKWKSNCLFLTTQFYTWTDAEIASAEQFELQWNTVLFFKHLPNVKQSSGSIISIFSQAAKINFKYFEHPGNYLLPMDNSFCSLLSVKSICSVCMT